MVSAILTSDFLSALLRGPRWAQRLHLLCRKATVAPLPPCRPAPWAPFTPLRLLGCLSALAVPCCPLDPLPCSHCNLLPGWPRPCSFWFLSCIGFLPFGTSSIRLLFLCSPFPPLRPLGEVSVLPQRPSDPPVQSGMAAPQPTQPPSAVGDGLWARLWAS